MTARTRLSLRIERTETRALVVDDSARSIALLWKRRQTMRAAVARLALRNRNAEDLQDLARLLDLLDADEDEIARLEQSIDVLRDTSHEEM